MVSEQLALQFDEAVPVEEPIHEELESNATETITYTRNKKGTGRKALPKSLPYIEQIHDLSDAEKQCACGRALTQIHDAVKANKKEGLAHQIVALMAKLYHIERELKDKKALPHQIFMRRLKKAKPVLTKIKQILDDAQLKVMPKTPLGIAVFYSLTH